MTCRVQRAGAMALATFVLLVSMVVTATVAEPQKKKPAPKKPPAKKDEKKDEKALIAAGKKVYMANGCAACHVIAGQGGTSGPELTKIGADPKKRTTAFLKESIHNPKADSPDSSMPSYEETIKGKDLDALIAYLQSLK
ncbi:MAG: cytochrome c [Chloroherpetonaceae bacterium]|nr:cytochrome c [Chthonomonadaceae bacterium]MDW8208031.1 cytochrome c [Chloroherpetonaceae bacterium]